jgi:hypothetical protein
MAKAGKRAGVAAPSDAARTVKQQLTDLERRLDKARAVESKRIRQLATAEASRSRREVAKRRAQVDAAAAEVADLVEKLLSMARRGAEGAVDALEDAAGKVGSAAATAATAVAPVKSSPPVTGTAGSGKPAATPRSRATTTRKPTTTPKATTRKPTTTPKATTRKPTTTPKATTRKPTTTTRKRATPDDGAPS